MTGRCFAGLASDGFDRLQVAQQDQVRRGGRRRIGRSRAPPSACAQAPRSWDRTFSPIDRSLLEPVLVPLGQCRTLPGEAYASEAVLAWERTNFFDRSWVCIGRATDLPSPYGPLFVVASYAVVPLGVAGALWTLKVVTAAASLAIVWLVWKNKAFS